MCKINNPATTIIWGLGDIYVKFGDGVCWSDSWPIFWPWKIDHFNTMAGAGLFAYSKQSRLILTSSPTPKKISILTYSAILDTLLFGNKPGIWTWHDIVLIWQNQGSCCQDYKNEKFWSLCITLNFPISSLLLTYQFYHVIFADARKKAALK